MSCFTAQTIVFDALPVRAKGSDRSPLSVFWRRNLAMKAWAVLVANRKSCVAAGWLSLGVMTGALAQSDMGPLTPDSAVQKVHVASPGASSVTQAVPRRWMVQFKATPLAERGLTTTQAAAQAGAMRLALIARHTGTSAEQVRQFSDHGHALLLPRGLTDEQAQSAVDALRNDPSVMSLEPDRRVQYHAVIPSDPNYAANAYNGTQPVGQWHLKGNVGEIKSAINAEAAWGYSQGSSTVVIAVLDTGVLFDHPDLKRLADGGRLLPGYDFVSGDGDGGFLGANDGNGRDADASDPGDWIDAALQSANSSLANCTVHNSSWHGTRTAGLIGALTQNGTGIAGVDWNARLLPVRVLGRCGGFTSDIVAGMRWAAGLHVVGVPDNPNPAKVINLSLGGTGRCSASEQSAVDELTARSVLVVASAGNESGPVGAPANCRGVLAVGGLRHIGTKVGYSSFGAEVGISAPAGNCVNTSANSPCLYSIDTTSNDGTTVPGVNGYTSQLKSNVGTSFSAPLVAGVAGLMLAVNPKLTPARLIAAMKSSATPFPSDPALALCPTLGATGTDSSGQCNCTTSQCGGGMLNAEEAVRAVNPANCLFDWAERSLPQLLFAGTASQVQGPYNFRYYPYFNNYLGIAADTGSVLYLDGSGVLTNLGPRSDWYTRAGCY